MSKPASTANRPAAWAQALFVGSVVFASLSVWLLATV